MKTFKQFMLFVHRWLGLISGLVVLVVSITGCIYVFEKEITEYVHHDKLYVTPRNTAPLPLSVLREKAQQTLGTDKPITYIQASRDPEKAWVFLAFKGNPEAVTYFGAITYYQTVLMNPYDGTVTGVIDNKYQFFSIVKYLHWSLLLNTPYGQPIVGWSTFIFVVLMITGLVLWWPKRKKRDIQQAFTIKWKARWRRVNYDLHNVLGFYVTIVALILAFTGMVWAFKWFKAAVYVTASGTTRAPEEPQVKSIRTADSSLAPLDMAYEDAVKRMPEALSFGIRPAFKEEATLDISGNRRVGTYYDHDELHYDQYSGKMLARVNRAGKNNGQKLIEMNYDIHVGAVWGLPGKILAFLGSLICASLPVTGFLVWWGKRNKKAKKSLPRMAAVQQKRSAVGAGV